MAVRDVGKAPPLPESEREALWTKLAIYLDRSDAYLKSAWDIDARRVRALPRFASAQMGYDIPVRAASAAATFRDEGLLAYAEELRGRVGFWFREEEGNPFQSAIMECAIEHARRCCGHSDEADAAFARLFALVGAKGMFGIAGEVFLRAGRTEIVPHLTQRPSDEALAAFAREAGHGALRELVQQRDARFELREPLPPDEAVALYPFLKDEILSGHQLLHRESRAHEHPREAAAIFTETAVDHGGAIFRTVPKVAAVLSIAAGLDETGDDARALDALRRDLLFVIVYALHFPRVREVLASRESSLASAETPAATRAVLDALAVFAEGDSVAAKRIAAQTKAVAALGGDEKENALRALFRIAMERRLPFAAHRVASALPKMYRDDPIMEVARAYADAGDLGGVVELLAKTDGVNRRRPDQTNPLAIAVLRSLA